MNRRQALRGMVAGFALCTGLARVRLEPEYDYGDVFGNEEYWISWSNFSDPLRYDADISFDGEVVRVGELGEVAEISIVDDSGRPATVGISRMTYSHPID